jgi:RTX calcium-binding nonapeptide repeat (4 copies)
MVRAGSSGGKDRICGGGGEDVLNGGVAADRMKGQGGIDFLAGGDGDDLHVGGADGDTIFANVGNASGSDVGKGGLGDDFIDVQDGLRVGA